MPRGGGGSGVRGPGCDAATCSHLPQCVDNIIYTISTCCGQCAGRMMTVGNHDTVAHNTTLELLLHEYSGNNSAGLAMTSVTWHLCWRALLSNAAFKSAPYCQSSISIMFELSIDIHVNPIVLGPPTKQAFKRNYCQIIMMSKLRNPTCRGILVTRQL